MSAENLKAFFEKAEGDDELRGKVKALADVEQDEAVSKLVKLGSEAGFEFDRAEVFSQNAEAGGRELSEEELKAVAGGGICPVCFCGEILVGGCFKGTPRFWL